MSAETGDRADAPQTSPPRPAPPPPEEARAEERTPEPLAPLIPPAAFECARAARRILAFLLPPALLLAAGAGMLGWTTATAASVLLPKAEIHPMAVALGFGRWTLVAGLTLCALTQGMHQARLRWRAPIRFR
jgi:hypothetical protein